MIIIYAHHEDARLRIGPWATFSMLSPEANTRCVGEYGESYAHLNYSRGSYQLERVGALSRLLKELLQEFNADKAKQKS